MPASNNSWPEPVPSKAGELHQLLRIGDREWHQLKNNRKRRSAELLASALVQLVNQGDPKDVEQLTEQALGWIRGELKDPGCPRH